MKNFLKDEKTRYFAIGVLAATAGVKFLKSRVFRIFQIFRLYEQGGVKNSDRAFYTSDDYSKIHLNFGLTNLNTARTGATAFARS